MTTNASSSFQLKIVADYAAMSRQAADVVAKIVQQNPRANIALPTGSTPVGMFQALADDVRKNTLSFSQTQFFCLDEYYPVAADHPASLTTWLHANFFDPCQVPATNVHKIPSTEHDPAPQAQAYETKIAQAGGLDLAMLGLGGNGHIAFNEPGSAGDSRTRVLNLTPESITQARGIFKQSTPTQAMTIGVSTLLEARQIVLIVSGAAKVNILHQALYGPQTAQVPASFLQRAADRLTVIADSAASPDATER